MKKKKKSFDLQFSFLIHAIILIFLKEVYMNDAHLADMSYLVIQS